MLIHWMLKCISSNVSYSILWKIWATFLLQVGRLQLPLAPVVLPMHERETEDSSLSITSNTLRKECSKGQLQASPSFIDLNQLNTRQLAAQSRGLPSIFPSKFLKWRLQMVKYLFLFVSLQNVPLSTRSERGSWYFFAKIHLVFLLVWKFY